MTCGLIAKPDIKVTVLHDLVPEIADLIFSHGFNMISSRLANTSEMLIIHLLDDYLEKKQDKLGSIQFDVFLAYNEGNTSSKDLNLKALCGICCASPVYTPDCEKIRDTYFLSVCDRIIALIGENDDPNKIDIITRANKLGILVQTIYCPLKIAI